MHKRLQNFHKYFVELKKVSPQTKKHEDLKEKGNTPEKFNVKVRNLQV